MSYTIHFWRKKKLTLKEIKYFVKSQKLSGLPTFVRPTLRTYDYLDIIKLEEKNLDAAIKKIKPKNLQREGIFTTDSGSVWNKSFQSVEINYKIASPNALDPESMSNEQYEQHLKDFFDNPEKWFTSPQQLRKLLRKWKPPIKKELENLRKKITTDEQAIEYQRGIVFQFYKVLSDMGFYVATEG